MFAAAGIVVTEIRTPISAPDFAVESESIPAVPASRATSTEKVSGCEMKNVCGAILERGGVGAEVERAQMPR